MHTKTKTIAVLLLSAAAACKGKQASPSSEPARASDTGTAKPTEALAAAPAPAATGSACAQKGAAKIELASGESLMKDREAQKQELKLEIKDTNIVIALVEKKKGEGMLMQIRAFSPCGATPLGEWMEKGDTGIHLEPREHGAVVVNSGFAEQTDVTKTPEGKYSVRQIRVDGGVAKLTNSWDCDGSKVEDDNKCPFPEWVYEGKLEDAPELPEG